MNLYQKINKIIPSLTRQEKEDTEGDFWIDEKGNQVIFLRKGMKMLKKFLLSRDLRQKFKSL